MKPLERDAAHLWDMLDAAKRVAEFSVGISLDQLLSEARTRYAIERALEIVGEAARRVSPQTTSQHREIPWKGIIGFRNVLAHRYGAIDYRRLYTVVEEGVPALIVALESILDSIENLAPQQNLWVDSGSDRAPSTGCKAVPAPWYVRKPKDFPEVGFALMLKPSTTPLENGPFARNRLSRSAR